jgi:hypothetical protein
MYHKGKRGRKGNVGEELSNELVLKHYGVDFPPDGPRWIMIPCPFHDDKHYSAASNGYGFVCHACGIKGGPIQLLMEREGIEYHDAIILYQELTGEQCNLLPKTTGRRRPDFNLSGEKRDYEGHDFFVQIRSGKGSVPRKRPRLSD